MATKYFCDRCNFVTIEAKEIKHLGFEWEDENYYKDSVKIGVDLCRNCAKKLKEWTEFYARVAEQADAADLKSADPNRS